MTTYLFPSCPMEQTMSEQISTLQFTEDLALQQLGMF